MYKNIKLNSTSEWLLDNKQHQQQFFTNMKDWLLFLLKLYISFDVIEAIFKTNFNKLSVLIQLNYSYDILTTKMSQIFIVTRKLIGFKHLRLNCSHISQVIQKCEISSTESKVSKMLKYFLIQSYLLHLHQLFSWVIYEYFRSSHRRCFMKKAVLKNFAMLTVHFRPATLSKKDYHWHFPLNIVKFLRTPILKNIC